MFAATIIQGGTSAGQATAIVGGEGSVTPAGSTYADATALTGKLGLNYAASVTSGTGVTLQAGAPGDFVAIANHDASNALLVYPPSGAAINRLTATTQGFSVTANKTAIFFCISATQWTGGFLT